MSKFLTIVGGVIVIVGFSVAYYFAIVLPKAQAQADLAKNQAACVQAEQNLLKELATQEQQSTRVYGISVPSAYSPIKAHYNTVLKKCYVEVDNYYASNNSTGGNFVGNDYAIYDATEDSEIAHCSLNTNYDVHSGGSNDTTQCEDYTISPVSTSTTAITRADFLALETQYLTQ